MTQQSGNQFDDDLTVGLDNDGSFSTDSIDLFEFSGDEESPIARLKTIILSIDWEINDDILGQLEDELVDLSEIWAKDKIKLIYIQGLSKIGKYIYKEKANAHPNSIKLLITFYHDLEKIVSSGDSMSEDEKKQLLVEDVKKFDKLKSQISSSAPRTEKVAPSVSAADDTSDAVLQLKKLKAQVLGIDWEINDSELEKLSDEVQRLEGIFSHSKAKLILLQGIGALGSYINKMRSNANGKAFTLLHSFYNVLETISSPGLSTEDEKQLLLTEVDKFKSFKAEIAQAQVESEEETYGANIPSEKEVPLEPADIPSPLQEVLPVDRSEDEIGVAADVDDRLASVFGDVEDDGGEESDESAALEGVNVETEADDDSEEEALPYEGGSIAPALAEVEEESSFSVEKLVGDLAESMPAEIPEEIIGSDNILQGIDVETEADDDSDEEALPFEDGEIAPALSGSFSDGGFDEESLVASIDDSGSEDLDSRLDSFFDDEVQASSEEWGADKIDVDEELIDEGLVPAEDEFVAALSDVAEEDSEQAEEEVPLLEEVTEEGWLPAEEEIAVASGAFAEDDSEPDLEEPAFTLAEDTAEQDDLVPAFSEVGEQAFSEEVSEQSLEDELSFFDEEEPAASEKDESLSAEDLLEEEFPEDQLSFLDEEIPAPESTEALDTFFSDYDGDVEEALSFTDEDGSPAPALSAEDESFGAVSGEESVGTSSSFFEGTDGSEDVFAEESLSFLDEEPESFFEDEPDESITPEEGDEEDEIQFTVPGEIAAAADLETTALKESSFDDIIEFNVPGEEDSSEGLFDSLNEFDKEGDSDSSEVVFEVVGDEVEVDPLPGEEFADFAQPEEVVLLEAGDIGYSVEDFQDINLFIGLLKDGVTENGLQNILKELNSLRNNSASTSTIKIFLQLLSTVCQHLEKMTSDDSASVCIGLMEEICSGLEASVTPEVPVEKVQAQLLSCATQVLLMQSNLIRKTQTVTVEEAEEASVESFSSAIDSVDDGQVFSDDSSEREELLKAVVHEELADIKKLFLEEIAALRKEFAAQ